MPRSPVACVKTWKSRRSSSSMNRENSCGSQKVFPRLLGSFAYAADPQSGFDNTKGR